MTPEEMAEEGFCESKQRLRELFRQARAEGYAQAIEDAARAVEGIDGWADTDLIAAAIRKLEPLLS